MTDTASWSYDQIVDHLLRYAAEDWLMLSTVVDWAEGVTGPGAAPGEVADATMRLSAALIDDGSPPGDLPGDDRPFAPWPGGRAARLDRLHHELAGFVARGRLPGIGDVCWFHRVEG